VLPSTEHHSRGGGKKGGDLGLGCVKGEGKKKEGEGPKAPVQLELPLREEDTPFSSLSTKKKKGAAGGRFSGEIRGGKTDSLESEKTHRPSEGSAFQEKGKRGEKKNTYGVGDGEGKERKKKGGPLPPGVTGRRSPVPIWGGKKGGKGKAGKRGGIKVFDHPPSQQKKGDPAGQGKKGKPPSQ